jgi:Glycosyl hydrolases family 2, sugar binding domain/Glycosyl hydrolases family 2/Glycosyl hydrolases family 2, TIM barrel domain
VERAVERPSLCLDGAWDFHFCGDARIELGEVERWQPCTVPAPWQAVFPDLRQRNGRAWYRRTFELPSDWLGGAVFLRFGAVNYHAQVLVNRTPVIEHEGGWLPFEAEIGAMLRPGANEVAVHVTAPTDDPAAYPEYPFSETLAGKQSWYGPLGGIWQSVLLERRASDHIGLVRVRPQRQSGTLEVGLDLSRPLSVPHVLELQIEAPDGRTVEAASLALDAGQERISTALRVAEPLDWSPDAPHLYQLRAMLRRGGDVADVVRERFGFRAIETRAGRIYLNGQPLFLRGALDQDYYPDGICTAPSDAFLEDQFRKAKALGLNCLRCHIKVPDPRYYAVADRVGVLIWTELPNAGRLTPPARARAEATLRGILERDGNHPSIICWTIINENWGTDLVHSAEDRAWLRRTVDWLKAADPDRLVVDNSPIAPSFHLCSDLEDFHFYAAIPDHRRSWDGFIEALAARPAWTYAPSAAAMRTGDEPLLCSEFGNWGLPDPERLRGPDGAEPWWFETGHDWGDGAAYPHGLENRFRAAGLERVFGGLPAFIEAAQWQQYRALKYQIETMRRRPTLAGYVITEFTDCHWESNGLLDMRRNRRVFHEAFAAINAETILVPCWERVAYCAGETIRVDLVAAHGGGELVPEVTIRWRCGAAAGQAGPLLLEPGVRDLPPAVFTAPALKDPAVERLELELAAAGRVLATNHVDLTVLPRHAPLPAAGTRIWAGDELAARIQSLGYRPAPSLLEADVAVASRLDESLCAAIRGGARVVLLADDPMELQPIFPHWQAARVVRRSGTMWQGDWISSFSWLRRDGPFARVPGGPLIDHAFDRVIPNHVIAGCNAWDFQARVHAGMVLGWVHKPAGLIVERERGRGKLVVTTFRLLEDAPGADPIATALLDGLIELAMVGNGEPDQDFEAV